MVEDFRAQITREDIQEAIAALERGEVHAFGPSISYDILEGGRRYPPKAVVGLAARRVLGRALRPDEFSGGEESWAFRLLRDRGFNVVKKLRSGDTSELPQTPTAQVWIENTNAAVHGHGGPGWEFGTCLWSPSSAEGGSDFYSLMREPEAGDFVIHFNSGVIVGRSRVAGPFQEGNEAPPNPAQWAGRSSYYRIPLTDYEDFPHKVPLSEFIVRHHDALAEELRTDTPKRFPFIINNDTIRRAQGAYLTRCTPKLYDLIRNEVYLEDEVETFDPVSRTWRRRPEGRGAEFGENCSLAFRVIKCCARRLRFLVGRSRRPMRIVVMPGTYARRSTVSALWPAGCSRVSYVAQGYAFRLSGLLQTAF